MKKISIFALTLIMTAGLMTACRAPVTDETTGSTAPSTTTTTPSTTTVPNTTTAPATIPTPSGTEGTTEGKGGINTMDPTESMPGKDRRMMPRR